MSGVDAYISGFLGERRERLIKTREALRDVLPEARELIKYRMPTFVFNGRNLVHYAAMKNHLGFYPGGEATAVFAGRLTGYKTTKGSIHFPYSDDMDLGLITDIAKWRLEIVRNGGN
jgi:uncharacterized protein YdhG (YjbR/CyaY superfamily)